jgi:hypothetical protein
MFFNPGQALGCADVEEKVFGVVTEEPFVSRKHAGKKVAAEVLLAR